MFPLTALLRNLSRGWSLSLANCYFARNSSGFPVLLRILRCAIPPVIIKFWLG
jgi:hypothetical protein